MIDGLSIIIPTLNEAGYLPALLESISRQTFTGKLQVILVDGHSTDETVQLAQSFARQFADMLIIEADRGVGHQRNIGADKAKYKYLLFLDADVVLPPRLLEQLAAKIRSEKPFVAGVMHTSQKMNLADRAFLFIVYTLMFMSWVVGRPASVGDFILTTRKNHRAIKGFAEGTTLGEDIDYGLRSVKAGAKNLFYFRPKVIASDRRVREMGRIRLLMLWSKGYLHVLKHGPIFPGEGFDYPVGQYGPKK